MTDRPPAKAHVLLVDDTPEMLFLYGTILRADGYRVTEASSGQCALEILASAIPDLVILDWMMPGMNGTEVLERARGLQGCKEVPVILLTAAGQRDELVTQIFDMGASDYITKPVNRRILLARVQAALDARQKNELIAHAEQLSLEKTELIAELERARLVQQGQLPPRDSVHGSWRLSGGLYPCAQVGGDIFDIVAATESGCTVALVDVSGHGIAAAMVAAGIRSSLRLLSSEAPLERVLERLNAQLCAIENGHYACVALVRTTDRDVEVINAGLPPVALFRDGLLIAQVAGSGVPPGLLPGSTYTSTKFAAPRDLRVVLTSDGFNELFEARDTESMLAQLGSAFWSNLRGEQWDTVVNSLMLDKRARQTDDATLVVLRNEQMTST